MDFHSGITIKRLGGLCFALLAMLVLLGSSTLFAADSITATKSKNPDNTYSVGGTDTFTIATNQTIRWTANYNPSMPTEGNDFYLHQSGQSLNQIALSTSLNSGFNSGEMFLNAGTYIISTTYFGMGVGSYTIEYNRTASISLSPGSHNFGTVLAGNNSANQLFSIVSTGDLPVTITGVTFSDPAHFSIVGAAPSGTAPASFNVRCNAGPAAGVFGSTITVTGSNPSVAVASPTATVNCTVELPVPNISCTGNPNLGTADWTTSETINISRSYSNTGTAPLVISNVQVVNLSPLAPFALNGAPSLAPLNSGSRSVAMTFTAPNAGGEATYSGQLRIDSNDPDEPVKLCPFTAVAHHPEPRMLLDDTVLDYHQVELGFAFTKAIIVRNAGDANLNLTVADILPLAADAPQWSNREVGATVVAPGGEAVFRQVFEPLATGNYNMQMRVSGDDPTNPEDIVTLMGEGIPPIPIDAVPVLDRSGSMNDAAGTAGTKLSAMKRAANLFTDLIAQRSDGLPAADADKLGLVEYNENNSQLLALDTLQGMQVTDAHNAIDGLTAGGNTGIGGAIQRAGTMLAGSPSSRKHVMVVMTDGKENVDPRIVPSVEIVKTNDPDIKMYSIGLGSNIEPDKLQAITNITNGYHQVADDLSGTSIFDLEAFYFKIFANATGMELVVDPTVPVNLNNTAPIVVQQAAITSSDKSATFLVLDVPALRPYYALELISPTGQIITPGVSIGGVAVHELTRDTYRLVRVVFPSLAQASDYVGVWQLRLTAKGLPKKVPGTTSHGYSQGTSDGVYNPGAGIVPIGFAAAVSSDYRMAVSAVASSSQPGATLNLSASFSDRAWPAPNAQARVTITSPSGTVYGPLNLYDDGTHTDSEAGDATFTTSFTQTAEAGSYKIFYKGQGYNERGELAPREATRYVSLLPPKPPEREEDCIPCHILKWLWAVVIALLLLGLWCCYRKRG
ncbi:choice-of-anchor D domain-containing protein [Dasania sp. GY-MA-18]|uniref:Choice-of-anchor D domain-containing protein n=1 Tax=Dasania phycosphaerae TaxID=2950436 RepID=A0A9J6RHP9_9GAMM|nr:MULTISPECIES: choice-of-anchor D domain-containing protein [Dasania]MCR8921462.1 choice-of-anchor D domain-containing protein [Dasania sp. GY-MA-18]MCZ0863890.1 choice-of-anchor D domain-containing protein [Dasania phycosphaerae]MCZ0867618.1 choice-of-anchor D domain-containing protein [Dasania phycosphaerae]